jgi:hypothetical protein
MAATISSSSASGDTGYAGDLSARGWVCGLVILAGAGCRFLPRPAPDEFPLRTGTSWRYRGEVITAEGRRDVELVVSVESSRAEDGVLLARLAGDLLDDATWDVGALPGPVTITRRGGRYERAAVPFLMLPLVEGQEICPAERKPASACWIVESITTENLGLEGAPAELRNRYRLVRTDARASRFFELVAGIGITAYGVKAGGRQVKVTLEAVDLR